jgi:hypothetical protein
VAREYVFRELSTGRYRDVISGKFIPNPIGQAAIAFGPQMEAMLAAEANKILDAAKDLARQEAYLTGDYYRSLRTSTGVSKEDKAMAGRVNAWDWKAGWIEFGSIHNYPPKRILSRAAEAVGYSLSAGSNARRIIGTGRERLLHLASFFTGRS